MFVDICFIFNLSLRAVFSLRYMPSVLDKYELKNMRVVNIFNLLVFIVAHNYLGMHTIFVVVVFIWFRVDALNWSEMEWKTKRSAFVHSVKHRCVNHSWNILILNKLLFNALMHNHQTYQQKRKKHSKNTRMHANQLKQMEWERDRDINI